ncbi:MAG: NAD(P)H-dependent oxidoreductase subunit E [Verrucomicrobia bacterium]|jgi:NADH:ubiquinone oxidoreductase subunit E|nr:NAD(P)H-dependent oxidoreductase subunit E [Verrucomicrobiota bacterium]MBT7069104.1 NAD(P)H-dependent oxidoreductase subunit E [Verrucomicrobiota bacterium]MBT7701405.1 NAD(P)H-dependent oxidoreductase subunit E [Verrucomicrobiota bacterium]
MLSADTKPRRTSGVRADSGLLNALHALQAEHGYVPRQEAMALSRRLGVPLARIFEVLTFYSYFRLEEPGRITLSVCDGTSCHLQEGPVLLKAIQALLGIGAGEATPDGAYQLNVVRCLGCCSCSPVLMVDDKIYSQVDPADLPGILKKHPPTAPKEAN